MIRSKIIHLTMSSANKNISTFDVLKKVLIDKKRFTQLKIGAHTKK